MKNKSYFLLIIGVILVSFQYVTVRWNEEVEKNKIHYTMNQNTSYTTKQDIYNMVLEIPKLKLQKGIYKKEDSRNQIDQNVTIHLKSNYPDEENSNVILLGHSGTGRKAIFNHLNQLDQNSLVKIYYKNKIYVYKIDNCYNVEKTGSVKILRDSNKKTITLITCNSVDKTKQLIYIGYLIDEVA